jgi:hypothetical protein
MENNSFIVVEGIHKDPNNIDSIDSATKKTYGPFGNLNKAEIFAKGLIQKNVDNFYHRAWVIKKNIKVDDVCEECLEKNDSVKQNLMMHSYKICNSCKISKNIFPI